MLNACTKILKITCPHEGEVVTQNLGTPIPAAGLLCPGEPWCSQHHCPSLPKTCKGKAQTSLCSYTGQNPAILEGLTLGEIISLVFCMEGEGTQVLVVR